MPDINPLNDSELEDLEARLSQVPLSPTPRERERLLYACGQAAGRAQMMRRVRGTTAVAGLLGCTCAGLVALLVLEKSPPVAVTSPTPQTAPQSTPLFPEQSPPEERDNVIDRDRQLTVAANFGELALAELPQKNVLPRESSAQPAAEPILTTAGPLSVEF